jgi:hypothetical protein
MMPEMPDGNPNDHKESASAQIYHCRISLKEYSKGYRIQGRHGQINKINTIAMSINRRRE